MLQIYRTNYMILSELLNKSDEQQTKSSSATAKKYLYHVTFTKNVPNIKKKGLIQFQPSNWIKGPGGDRYNNDIAGIFAFDHPEDALNWAGKMEYEFRDTDKNISIVRIDMEDFWEDDPAEDPFVSNKGKAKYSPRDIKADKIIDVLDMSGIKRPGDLGISRDEWLADVSKKLTELHGGGGIPDYTTMPAYGLKRASKGKHKFFVPKGEKLPAGVGAIKEATQKYYHGSYDKLENGTILTPGGDDYEASWGGTSFYGPLEKFRPPEKLAHKEGVFMVGDIDDVDVAGGATEYIYIVEPIGDVQKHDLNWGSEISGLMDNGKKPNDKEVKQAADNYWNGVPHHNEQVWEYLAPRAKIVSVLDEAWKVKVPTKKKRKMSKQDKDWSMLRTALESDLFEAGTGDCFEVANRAMIGMTEEQEVYGMKCIHAYVYGQGDLKGRRFPHAWNEQGDVVFDNSNGNNIVMRKEQYYALGGVVQESGAYATYDKDDCLIKMLKYSHYGPWDLNDSLDENIPDEAKEIGKEKSRIPRNLLNTIKNELDLEAQVESAWEKFKSNVE